MKNEKIELKKNELTELKGKLLALVSGKGESLKEKAENLKIIKKIINKIKKVSQNLTRNLKY